jgi:hypothetical protein
MTQETDHWTWANRTATICSIASGAGLAGQIVWAIVKFASTEVPFWLLVSSSVTAAAFGFFLGWLIFRRRPTTPANVILTSVGQIGFEYLPGPLIDRGWKLGVENEEKKEPEVSRPSDAPFPGSISIVSHGRYYLDYHLDPSLQFSDAVEYAIKPGSEATLYLRVCVKSADGSRSSQMWLAHRVGRGKPRGRGGEWAIESVGPHMGNGWHSVRCILAEEVRVTCGQEGWVYDHIVDIRLRGSLSLSPIRFFSTEGHSEAQRQHQRDN